MHNHIIEAVETLFGSQIAACVAEASAHVEAAFGHDRYTGSPVSIAHTAGYGRWAGLNIAKGKLIQISSSHGFSPVSVNLQVTNRPFLVGIIAHEYLHNAYADFPSTSASTHLNSDWLLPLNHLTRHMLGDMWKIDDATLLRAFDRAGEQHQALASFTTTWPSMLMDSSIKTGTLIDAISPEKVSAIAGMIDQLGYRPTRFCVECNGALDRTASETRITCSTRCRVAMHRRKKAA